MTSIGSAEEVNDDMKRAAVEVLWMKNLIAWPAYLLDGLTDDLVTALRAGVKRRDV